MGQTILSPPPQVLKSEQVPQVWPYLETGSLWMSLVMMFKLELGGSLTKDDQCDQ
jgi:hypothetical protein